MFEKIKIRFYRLKACWQRFRRGYADVDVWDFNYWFLKTIPKMLKQLKAEGLGYPLDMTFEEWHDYLGEMANHFEEANKFDEEPDLPEGATNQERCDAQSAIYNRSKKHLSDGLEMLNERFFDLWD